MSFGKFLFVAKIAKYKDEEDVLLTEKYENGIFTKLKRWMDVNSERFGFYLTYVNDKNRKGFEYEPWHYSYKPVSVELLNIFILILHSYLKRGMTPCYGRNELSQWNFLLFQPD